RRNEKTPSGYWPETFGPDHIRLITVDGEGKLTARMERLPYRQELDTGRVTDEGDCGDGPGCGNGRDEAGGAARAAGGVARQPLGRELRRCRCSGSCVGIHRG